MISPDNRPKQAVSKTDTLRHTGVSVKHLGTAPELLPWNCRLSQEDLEALPGKFKSWVSQKMLATNLADSYASEADFFFDGEFEERRTALAKIYGAIEQFSCSSVHLTDAEKVCLRLQIHYGLRQTLTIIPGESIVEPLTAYFLDLAHVAIVDNAILDDCLYFLHETAAQDEKITRNASVPPMRALKLLLQELLEENPELRTMGVNVYANLESSVEAGQLGIEACVSSFETAIQAALATTRLPEMRTQDIHNAVTHVGKLCRLLAGSKNPDWATPIEYLVKQSELHHSLSLGFGPNSFFLKESPEFVPRLIRSLKKSGMSNVHIFEDGGVDHLLDVSKKFGFSLTAQNWHDRLTEYFALTKKTTSLSLRQYLNLPKNPRDELVESLIETYAQLWALKEDTGIQFTFGYDILQHPIESPDRMLFFGNSPAAAHVREKERDVCFIHAATAQRQKSFLASFLGHFERALLSYAGDVLGIGQDAVTICPEPLLVLAREMLENPEVAKSFDACDFKTARAFQFEGPYLCFHKKISENHR